MKCPVCKNVDLIVTEHRDVEIEQCPFCCGIWFDRSMHWTAPLPDRHQPRGPAAPIRLRDPICPTAPATSRTAGREFRIGPPSSARPPRKP